MGGVLAVLEYPTFLEAAGVVAAAFAAWGFARWYSPAPPRVRGRRPVDSPDPLSQLASSEASRGLTTVLGMADAQVGAWVDRAGSPTPSSGRPAVESRSPVESRIAVARRLRRRIRFLRSQVRPGHRRGWARPLLGPVDRARLWGASAAIEELLREVEQVCPPDGERP